MVFWWVFLLFFSARVVKVVAKLTVVVVVFQLLMSELAIWILLWGETKAEITTQKLLSLQSLSDKLASKRILSMRISSLLGDNVVT